MLGPLTNNLSQLLPFSSTPSFDPGWYGYVSKDLRTELYQILYEPPIYPTNLYLKRAPMQHAAHREKVIKRQIRLMHERGIWKKPER